MKTIFNKLFIAACAAGALSGCIREDDSMCPPDTQQNQNVTEVLTLRVKDKGNGTDITMDGNVTDATLVFFNSDRQFLGTMNIPGDRLMEDIILPDYLANYDGDVWVSAWGNVASGNVSYVDDFTDATYGYSSSYLDMNMDPANRGFHASPGEIFFGTQQVKIGGLEQPATRQTVVRRQQIDITQKNAGLMLTIRGLPDPQEATDYYIVASNLRDGYQFDGIALNDPTQPRADVSVRRQKAVFNASGDLVSPNPIKLFHQNHPDQVTEATSVQLHLYQITDAGIMDFDLAGAIMTDTFGQYIPLYSGQTTNVLISFDKDACTCNDNDVDVQVKVTEWDEVEQWAILDWSK